MTYGYHVSSFPVDSARVKNPHVKYAYESQRHKYMCAASKNIQTHKNHAQKTIFWGANTLNVPSLQELLKATARSIFTHRPRKVNEYGLVKSNNEMFLRFPRYHRYINRNINLWRHLILTLWKLLYYLQWHSLTPTELMKPYLASKYGTKTIWFQTHAINQWRRDISRTTMPPMARYGTASRSLSPNDLFNSILQPQSLTYLTWVKFLD